MPDTPSASQLLRAALDDAPQGLHVRLDDKGRLRIHDGLGRPVGCSRDEHEATLRVLQLLLAAAPQVVELLDVDVITDPMRLTMTSAHAQRAVLQTASETERSRR